MQGERVKVTAGQSLQIEGSVCVGCVWGVCVVLNELLVLKIPKDCWAT